MAQDVALVIVTQGGDGASALTRQHAVTVQAPSVQVVDAVSARATFQAALFTLPFFTRLGEQNLHSADVLSDLDADRPRRAELP
jgi:hypothetical protein